MNLLEFNANYGWIVNSLSKSVAGHDNAVHGQSGVRIQLRKKSSIVTKGSKKRSRLTRPK